MAELYVMTARFWRRFDLELHDTTEERDVLLKHDCTVGLTDRSSPGIQVKVVGEHKD